MNILDNDIPLGSTGQNLLVRVVNVILLKADCDEDIVVVLLDICAAFDVVDGGILIDRLNRWVWYVGNCITVFAPV